MRMKLVALLVLATAVSGCAGSYTNETWPCDRRACDWKPISQGSVVQ